MLESCIIVCVDSRDVNCKWVANLQNMVAAVQGQLRVQHSTLDAKGLQEESEAIAFVDTTDEEQHLALHQAQLQQHHHM